jgi:hypothetical protein
LTRLNRFFGTGNSGENAGNSRIKTVSDLESKLKPGIPKGKGIRKEIISNGNLWKDNRPITCCGTRSVLRDKEKAEIMLATTGSKPTLIRESKS